MSDAHDHGNEGADATPQANEINPSRQLRSALCNDPETAEPSPEPLVDSDKTPVQPPSRSKPSSSSKKKRKQAQSQPAVDQPQQATDMPPDIPDTLIDSSEETDTQIASQLGQDLELAVDMDDRNHPERANIPNEPSARKRKRVQEEPSPSTKTDRRRSTRLSTVKDVVNVESLQPDSSPSHPVISRAASASKSLSPIATRRSTRSSQRKDDDDALADSAPPTQDSVVQGPTQDADTPRPSKRSRKSVRLDQSVLDSTPKNAPRDTRSRKTRSQQHAFEASQPEVSSIPSEEHGDTDRLPPQIDHEMVPESLITEDQAEQSISLVSTEEATATQVSEMKQSTEPPAKPDTEIDIDMDAVQQPDGMVEQTTSAITMGIQTQQTPPAKSDISEQGIVQSLNNLLDEMKATTLTPSAFREVDDLLFKLRCEAQNASTRHNTSA
jgi:hypothetical protein